MSSDEALAADVPLDVEEPWLVYVRRDFLPGARSKQEVVAFEHNNIRFRSYRDAGRDGLMHNSAVVRYIDRLRAGCPDARQGSDESVYIERFRCAFDGSNALFSSCTFDR